MPPYSIERLEEARADVRTLDRTTAMCIFEGVLHLARTGVGDVTTLHGDIEHNSMRIFGVRHRYYEAYR